MAQAGSMMKTNWRLKILADCPFKQSFFCTNVYSVSTFGKFQVNCIFLVLWKYIYCISSAKITEGALLKPDIFWFSNMKQKIPGSAAIFFFFQRSRRICWQCNLWNSVFLNKKSGKSPCKISVWDLSTEKNFPTVC